MVAIAALSEELVGKAKKGTLVYTDIPLVQKLDDENIKINLNGGDRKSEHSLNQSGNITRLISKKNDSDYIFGRLKRDAELGDEKAIEVVEKAKKGTLVYTDIPLVQKLESAPKVNLPNVTDKSQDMLSFDNVVKGELSGNSQDYIFGRLKRDAELGDEKAIVPSQELQPS